MSGQPEFINQVALARWRGRETTALFLLFPNLRESPEVTWEPLEGQNLTIKGPNWADRVLVAEGELKLIGSDGTLNDRVPLWRSWLGAGRPHSSLNSPEFRIGARILVASATGRSCVAEFPRTSQMRVLETRAERWTGACAPCPVGACWR